MLKKIIPITIFSSLCLLIVMLSVYTPVSAGPFGILAVFMLAYLLSLGVITYFLYWSSQIISHVSIFFVPRKPLIRLSFKQSYYYATVFAAIPIMLMALQSVGSIGFYEIILVIFFVVLGCLYISKRSH